MKTPDKKIIAPEGFVLDIFVGSAKYVGEEISYHNEDGFIVAKVYEYGRGSKQGAFCIEVVQIAHILSPENVIVLEVPSKKYRWVTKSEWVQMNG